MGSSALPERGRPTASDARASRLYSRMFRVPWQCAPGSSAPVPAQVTAALCQRVECPSSAPLKSARGRWAARQLEVPPPWQCAPARLLCLAAAPVPPPGRGRWVPPGSASSSQGAPSSGAARPLGGSAARHSQEEAGPLWATSLPLPRMLEPAAPPNPPRFTTFDPIRLSRIGTVQNQFIVAVDNATCGALQTP
eukprot:scaffold55092_cov47-Phaeocystis_antarctica.AAC.2